ncbi:hypothetical protein Mesil_2143 [Allomeiothermus silvanus DSM 9946]|uniref:Uncharacterized protein n=1 Tax=Allomeiothermus silvanus (strain ATCC 700542 / DSM 9946 / NBRC 106475 / NCIMB 13440 / VI-R2) TaxID=526227 RepID=D7BHS4_ALLS1|nr:hypothetical protein [Allomeiothermus silvanus]ADH64014.1 hypothetical protein Mesil_2143 [Allomeiothermus silvanus DSM 9946]
MPRILQEKSTPEQIRVRFDGEVERFSNLCAPLLMERVSQAIEALCAPYSVLRRPLNFQMELLRRVGYSEVEVLHKNSVFAAFYAVK